jgi:hypothetical protein
MNKVDGEATSIEMENTIVPMADGMLRWRWWIYTKVDACGVNPGGRQNVCDRGGIVGMISYSANLTLADKPVHDSS